MKFTPQNFEVGKTYVTAYKNSITIDNSKNATITIFDKWRTNKDSIRNKVFKVNLRVAELYFYAICKVTSISKSWNYVAIFVQIFVNCSSKYACVRHKTLHIN